jgi:hypothetical protein
MRKKKNHNIDRLKAIRGLERQAHFTQGGTPSQWRGQSWSNKDRRKEADRKACRRSCESPE